MAHALRILHLEDDPRDTELMVVALRDAGITCDVVRVDTREQFVAKLADRSFDVVISDVAVPGFVDARREMRSCFRHGYITERKRSEQAMSIDLHLPDTPGDEALRWLWEDVRTRDIPVAILSADAMLSQSRRLIATGVKAYLTKPLDVSRSLAVIDERLAP